MARSDQHEMVVVDLEPFDPVATRAALAGEGVSDEFREVRSYEDDAELKDAKRYGTAIQFPATLKKDRDKAEQMSQIGDLSASRLRLSVSLRDLLIAGIITTTAGAPFKKGDRIKRFRDHQDRVIQEWDDAVAPYVIEVKVNDAMTYFSTIILECESRNAT